MGEVVGAGILAHVPTMMLPPETRLELNEGKEISLVPALHRLREEVFETLDYDTVVVLDSHWFTTVEFVVTAQDRRSGLFTAEELPRGMCRIPYDWRGDPELAWAMADAAPAHSTWVTANDDHYLPMYYATLNLWKFLGEGLDKRWMSVSVAQTGEGDRIDEEQTAVAARTSCAPAARSATRSRPPTARSCCSPRARCRTPSGSCASCATTRPATRSTSARRRPTPPTSSGSRGSRTASTSGCWRRCPSSCPTGRSRCSPTT